MSVDNTQILLHKEGLFVRAYEHSAYLFTSHIKLYNITKKFYKNVNQEVVYLGFPQSSLSKIESICKEHNLTITEDSSLIKITGVVGFLENEFVNWKNKIPVQQSAKILSQPSSNLQENKIIAELKAFNLVNKTPIECQSFIVELQNKIDG